MRDLILQLSKSSIYSTNPIQPESYGATVDEGFIVGGPVGDFELLLCHGTVCVVGKMRDLILQLSKSSIYSTKPTQVKDVSSVYIPSMA
ncbi:hypothetical protein HJX30_26770 (plasmid) [Klebsiella pneumoniae]|nr:hypothetical protein HJX30_26770 [Klebsiella pneumoniae]